MNIAIVGSRDFADAVLVQRVVDRLIGIHGDPIKFISGGATGADSLAEAAARKAGAEVQIFPAQWDKFGKAAGFRRNKQIVEASQMVVAFFSPGPRSKGTSHTVRLAHDLCMPVHIYHEGKWITE